MARALLLVALLGGLALAQNSLDSALVQMLNQPREQWELICNRFKATLKEEDVVPAIKRGLQLAVKGQDREAASMMRAVDFIDFYLTGKTEYRAIGQLTLATYFLQQHLPTKAQPVLEALLEYRPENSDGWVLLGHVNLESDPLRAIEIFKKAAALNPQLEGAYLGLAQAYFLTGQNKAAMQTYKRVLEINPSNGMAREAVKYLQNPKAAQAALARTEEGRRYFQVAEELYARGKYQDAIQAYDAAIKADPKFSKAWTYKGDAYYQLGSFDKAMTCYRTALKLDPGDKQAWRKLGDVLERRYSATGDKKVLDECIAAYQKALSIDPNYGNAQDDLARALKLRDAGATTAPIKSSPSPSPAPK